MKWKSTCTLCLFFTLTTFSWLILVDAHPAEHKDLKSSSTSLGFSSDELPSEVTKLEDKNPLTRNKRTIGFLRQLFPGISQIIDRKIQQITRILFRVVGRLILRGGGNGNGGGGSDSGGDGGRKISITLPTYPPSEDDDEDTEVPTEKDSASTDSSSDIDAKAASPEGSNAQNSSSTESSSNGDSIAATSPTDAPESNMIVRKSRDVSDVLSDTTISSIDSEVSSSTAESTSKSGGLLWRLGRGKRGSLLGSSGGGSGNFVFDIIRLIAGSGVTPEKEEELNAPRDERDGDSVDGNEVNDTGTNSSYNPEEDTSGIPGPLTRFALLVNRGISNVFKDLILLCPSSDVKCKHYKTNVLKNVANKIR